MMLNLTFIGTFYNAIITLKVFKFMKDSSVTLTGKQYPIFTEPINPCQL